MVRVHNWGKACFWLQRNDDLFYREKRRQASVTERKTKQERVREREREYERERERERVP